MSAADPNRFAGPVEAEILKEHIVSDEGELARVDSRLVNISTTLHDAEERLRAAQEEVTSARDIMSQICARKDHLLDSLRLARGLLHPLRRLPDDVLANIFLVHLSTVVGRQRRIPFVLAGVCRRWRRVALDTSALWCTLDLALDDVEKKPTEWTVYADCLLQRSKNHRLSLSLELYSANPSPERLRSVKKLTAHRRRWHDVTITCHDIDQTQSLGYLPYLLQGSAPILESLSLAIVDNDGSYPPIAIKLVAPRLYSLELLSTHIDWARCYKMSSLSKSTLYFRPMTSQSLTAMSSVMPNLRTLDLEAIDFDQAGGLGVTIFPNLQSLRNMVGANKRTIAEHIQCPRLEELESTDFDPGISASIALLRNAAAVKSPLRKLVMRRSTVDSTLASALSIVHSLEELCIHDCTLHTSFFEAMASLTTQGTWIAPRLSRLHIYKSSSLREPALQCDPEALQRLVRARLAASMEIDNPHAPCALTDVLRQGWDN
ncbi:hypothetical protein EXIGLDRAFT_638108 [Exidia glandulosa HHB12029]|uniref:Uncharacterized protein n=1 Tax=Exidia glandulosa HHB12029 TaxID=1314781 RepID=A0A165PAZ9_EXIGL|nr:hypothetical protein EXIGLDRAFT_638108 [Exidia glandulosa HHB12029]